MDLDWKHSGIADLTGIDTCEPWLQEILLLSLASSENFARAFLPETFNRKMTYQQKEVWKLLDNRTLPKVGACCYRGFGKSSMAEARIIKGVCFRQFHHVMVVGATHDSAASATENIKTELLTNNLIRDVFGDFKPRTQTDLPLQFSKKAYFLSDESGSIAFIHPKGVGQPIRGARVKVAGATRRPDFIFPDDVETDEGVMNEETRLKTRRWFDNALFHCVGSERPDPRTGLWVPDSENPYWNPPWQFFYTDTLKHPDAHIAKLMANTSWHFKSFPQAEFRVDTDGNKRLYSLVPDIVTHEQVREEYREAKEAGNLDGYCQEKLCTPMSEEMASWKREYFRYYDEATFIPGSKSMFSLNAAEGWENFMIVDPSRNDTPHSVPSGIIMCSANYDQGRVCFRDTISEKLSTKRLLDRIFDLAVDYRTKIIGVEITGLEDAGRHLFTSAAQQRGMNIEFVWLDGRALPKGDFGKGSDAAKRARSSQILPYYEAGVILHERKLARGALESAELSYPKCAEWGLLDCAGYVPTMLAQGGRIFQFKPKGPYEAKDDPFDDQQDEEAWDEFMATQEWRML